MLIFFILWAIIIEVVYPLTKVHLLHCNIGRITDGSGIPHGVRLKINADRLGTVLLFRAAVYFFA